MNKNLAKIKKTLKRNSPTILSVLASVGVGASIVLSAKATPKAIYILEEKKKENASKIDKIKAVAPLYLPTATVGLATIACVFGANVLNKKHQELLIGEYMVAKDFIKRYRTAANKVYGDDADSKIQIEMAENPEISSSAMGFNHVSYSKDLDYTSEKILFYDFYSQRYFESTLASVIAAQYHINRNLMLRGQASVNEYYSFIGIEPIKNGDDVGWCLDNLIVSGFLWLDFEQKLTKMEDGLECCITGSIVEPEPFLVLDEELYSDVNDDELIRRAQNE